MRTADEDLIGPADPSDPPGWAQQRAHEAAGDKFADELLARPRGVRQAALYRLALDDPAAFVLAKYGPSKEQVDIEEEVHRLRVRHEGQRRFQSGLLPDQDPPTLTSLTAFLAEPDEDVRYRVDGLWPSDGRILLTAQYKAGKTTTVNNLVRSLADGDPFLDMFAVERADRVVLIDNELPPNMIRRWLREQGIRKTDVVDVVSLRGRLSSFNILDPEGRAEWAERLGPADVLIFDCLRPALDALGLSEANEAGRFLTALDELANQAGIAELLLVHHMGHANERGRGDSRLLDWPDALWKLVRDGDEDADEGQRGPARFFSAMGRDVDQPERRLAFDPETRHLSINGPGRKRARASDLEAAVREWVQANPGCSQNSIESNVEGKNEHVRAAVKTLVREGWLRIEIKGRAHLHYDADGGAAADFSEPI